MTLAVRQIQTHLMVAALSCGHSTQYNAFVNRFATDIKSNGDALNRYFSRQYGGSSKSQLNAYITRIANEASRTSMVNRQGFCEEANAVFQSLMGTNPGQLATYATANQPFSIQAGSCTTRTAQK
ncbi:hypothetical protein IHV25_03260 [Phaeovibrio sulfidiphilus]|uniref:Uncharacterized protein n=1 Tax=Phaeovibrio sulfidiphilus TaxID=1220600 RepID=A0A8J6YNM0_9PROT|nr:hypothetical protein [Phaeovibrio sulfidiphilus]